MNFFGRRVIYTDEEFIHARNVANVLGKAMPVHAANAQDCDFLWRYYRGDQPILQREKDVRPEICNRVVENRANEIVTFKTGYLMGEPVQYVGRGEISAEAIGRLNRLVFAEGKASKDKMLADWFHICGTAYRVVLPKREEGGPFSMFTADPRTTFVVYSSSIDHRPMLGVHYRVSETGQKRFSCYTQNRYFEVEDGKVIRKAVHLCGGVPIIEYPLNEARLGAFEVVLELLDAINTVDSNRLDDIEQTVQSLLLFHNVEVDRETFDEMRAKGALKYTDIDPQMKGDVGYIANPLQQVNGQTVMDHLYQAVLTITGMPNRNGGTSTSDTGTAVIMRDGWSAAEARAKDTEMRFRESEREFLRIVFNICRNTQGADLALDAHDVEVRFTRRNYENILQKAQVLDLMLNNPQVAPRLAFEHCGMFPDPDLACKLSEEAYERYKADAERLAGDRAAAQGGQPGGAASGAGQGGNRGNPAKAAGS